MVQIFRIAEKFGLNPNSLEAFSPAERVLVDGDGVISGTVVTPTGPTHPIATRVMTAPSAASSSFLINVTYDSSVNSAPAGFKTAITAAVQYLESQFSDPVTININVGFGEVDGQPLGAGALGESLTYLSSYSYSQLTTALRADAKTATDTTAIASLPASSPTGGTFWSSTAEAKALGLAGASSATDGYVGFSATNPFDYAGADGITAGQYDFYGTALHEMTEVMGRMMLTGGSIGGASNSNYLLDLFHYSAAGTHSFSASKPGYFSVDGGTTNLGGFNTVSGGDAGDWGSAMGNDSFNAFSNSGVINGISSTDLTLLDTIGWDRTDAPAGTVPFHLTTDTGASSTDRITANAALTGTAAANAVVTITESGTTLGTATASAKGAWSFTPTGLTQGSHTLTASEQIAGQTVSSTLSFTYDSLAPTLTIGLQQDTGASATDHITSNLALTGTADAGDSIKLVEGTKVLGTVVAGSTGAWSFTPTGLAVGIHKIVATTQDVAGNGASASLTFAYATAEPTAALVTPTTAGLSGADARGSLAKGLTIGSVTHAGGSSADKYSYVLGGDAASQFKLTTTNNTGTLSTGATALAGQVGGKVYGLTVAATDTTIGETTQASALDVIVGTAGADTIHLGSLLTNAATPAFIFGLAGNDVIDGTGASGHLWVDGGAGADSMTGGSGANTYLYGAVSDSTPAAMDTITNFNAAADQIDLTGIGKALKIAGVLSGSDASLAAGSVGWLQSGGNTFVYANTGTKPVTLGAASLEIALSGNITLAAGNFAHS